MIGKEKIIQMLKNNVEEFIKGVAEGCGCPNEIGLKEDCNSKDSNKCFTCWRDALNQEVSE